MGWSKFDLAMCDPRFPEGRSYVYREEPRVTIQGVVDNLEDGQTPEAVAAMYRMDLKLVPGTQRFLKSQSVMHPAG